MASWTAEAPGVVERLLKENAPEVRSLARFLRRRNPALVLAAARGRGGLAALYAKHLLEARLLWPVLPLALPLFALYGARPKAPFPSLLLAYDLAGEGTGAEELVRAYRGEGVLTLAFVGREESPLAGAAEAVLPLHLGGAEGAGFLAGLAATAQLAAHLLEEPRLREALPALPEAMARALEGEEGLEVGEGLFVLGPGFAYPVALEAALRLKEAGLRAEGVAALEELFPAGLPLLVLVGRDGVLAGLIPALEGLKAKGVPLFVLSPEPEALALADLPLPLPVALAPELDPILLGLGFHARLAAR